MPTLYLIRGVPGSGKSTFANNILQAGLVAGVVEADDYFIDVVTGEYNFDPSKLKNAHSYCQSLAETLIFNGWSVAVSNTQSVIDSLPLVWQDVVPTIKNSFTKEDWEVMTDQQRRTFIEGLK